MDEDDYKDFIASGSEEEEVDEELDEEKIENYR